MTTWALIGAMAVAIYALRLSGFLLADATIPAAWERALGFVPVAALTALVVAGLSGRHEDAPASVIAVAVAGLVVWRWRRHWLCFVSGLACFWLLRLL